MLVPVSVLIPAKNEALNIAEAVRSVNWASEVWVVDSESEDGTAEAAVAAGAKVVQFHYSGYGYKKKNWALRNISFANQWVLILDADERVTPELRVEIERAIPEDRADGYYVDREYIFMGRSLRCFRPNWNLRLFKRDMGSYELLGTNVGSTGDNEVHEHVLLQGRVGYLRYPLRHEDRRPLRAWVENHNRYSDWEAAVYEQLRKEPLEITCVFSVESVWRRRLLKRIWVRLPARPLGRFVLFYIGRLGFLDGKPGLWYACLMAYYEFLISLKLRDGGRRGRSLVGSRGDLIETTPDHKSQNG